MVELVSIEQARDQVRLWADDSSEDPYLDTLIIAARRSVEKNIDRRLDDEEAGLDDDDKAVLVRAMLLLIGHWYANREAATVGQGATELPLAVHWLLAPYRSWSV